MSRWHYFRQLQVVYGLDNPCCFPPGPQPPEPFELITLESEWINVSTLGMQVAITPSHPDPSLYFLVVRSGVIKRYVNFTGIPAVVSLDLPGFPTALLPASNISNGLGTGRTLAQGTQWFVASGTPVTINVLQAAATAASPLVKVHLDGLWMPPSLC